MVSTFYIEEQKLVQALELTLKEFDDLVEVLIADDRSLQESIQLFRIVLPKNLLGFFLVKGRSQLPGV